MDQIGTQAASLWSSVADRTARLKGDVAKALDERRVRLAAGASPRLHLMAQQPAPPHPPHARTGSCCGSPRAHTIGTSTLAEAEERREAQLAAQAELRERIRKLREEAEELGPRRRPARKSNNDGAAAAEGEGAAREGGAVDEEEEELTMAERGALIGSVLLSPSGIAGVVVGGAVGGAAGFVADKVDGVKNHVASAYSERMATEREIAQA
eukprot:7376240-Prymnesium_polylepis.1